jgi:hypothetical protein
VPPGRVLGGSGCDGEGDCVCVPGRVVKGGEPAEDIVEMGRDGRERRDGELAAAREGLDRSCKWVEAAIEAFS